MGSLYADDVLQIARNFLGYHEGSNNWTIFSKVLDDCGYFSPQKKQNQPWCAIFCDFCCEQAAIPSDRPDKTKKYDAQYFLYQPSYKNYSAGAKEFADYFKAAGAWYTSKPQVGDMCFFYVNGSIGHVGIIEDTDEYITTIEGNAGDQVQRKWYSYSDGKIAGYGRPRYDGLINPANNNHEPDVDPAPEPTDNKYKVSVNSYLTIRTGASTLSPSVGKLFDGAIVSVLEEKDGWGRISGNCWVCMDYLIKP